ncbi:hypothetical protein SteCoe_10340 [Stentor coeruleus]|uniref:RING-type domain-containing protein n=1 Tax=Stentor coeruleus TaxID=5963 RepID=A0A1R2CFZ1_9CILI|nr:hypothetical protein SteCoe_10340 [Stentor coeruleus]
MDRTNHPLDKFFLVPVDGLRFLGFECVIGLVSSLIISLTSVFYIILHPTCLICDSVMSTWLMLISGLRFIDVPIKIFVLCRIYNLSKRINHEDRRFMIRRLMDLVRSGLFTLQGVVNYLSYFVFVIGIMRIKQKNDCSDSQFYQFCLAVMITFTLRLIIGAVNYKYEERKVINRGVPEFTQFFKHGATLHDIESVRLITVNEENAKILRDLCAICTEEFSSREEVRILPCSDSHNFHKDCIDRWLIQKDACPLCGVSIRKLKSS